MRLLALAFALCLGVSGCSTYKALTANYDNPITEQTLYNAEAAGVLIFAGLNAYYRACKAGEISSTCKGVIAKLQVQTKKLPGLLATVRKFVKDNDQVNAKIAYQTLMQVLTDIKATAQANNVAVQ